MIKISRIVTVYSQWHYLGWLSDDALFEPTTEYIIVDDASPEAAPAALLNQLQQRGVCVHRMARNSGLSAARNAGAALARGEFLDFIDGDDVPLPLIADPSWGAAELIFFPAKLHGEAATERQNLIRLPVLHDAEAPGGYLDPRATALLWRRSAFEQCGGFDPRYEYVEDVEMLLRNLMRPRVFASQPKQSYNEQRRVELTELGMAAAQLQLYRRLPESHPLREQLIADRLRAVHQKATWLLLRRGERGYLFRAWLALVRNLLKSRASLQRKRG